MYRVQIALPKVIILIEIIRFPGPCGTNRSSQPGGYLLARYLPTSSLSACHYQILEFGKDLGESVYCLVLVQLMVSPLYLMLLLVLPGQIVDPDAPGLQRQR